jgi:ubiquinone/menaquinone biosynthesis C-methylase UbiE
MTNDAEKKQTIDTYNKSASAHAEKFNKMGARTEDIKRTFSYIEKPNPKTIEIGFGSGRDAKEIIKYTNDYLGIDLSLELCKLAQQSVPKANFKLADLETYQFPDNVNVIFAFASLLHSDKNSVKDLLGRVYESLSPGGVFFISLKYGAYHKETIDKEGHGPKTYYFYTPEEIEKLCPSGLKIVFRETQDFSGQKWFSIILQKVRGNS